MMEMLLSSKGPTEATDTLWGELQKLQKAEREKGGVLDMDTDIVSSLTSHKPGYISECSASPVPTLMVFIGGAVASDREARASAERYGHLESSIAPEATFMEKAIQVGHPHSLQFFFGDNLKISRPLSAIVILYPPYVAYSRLH